MSKAIKVNMNSLEVGTKFWVINGQWEGKIVKKGKKKFIKTGKNEIPVQDNDMDLTIRIIPDDSE